jgi:hypothetical protein
MRTYNRSNITPQRKAIGVNDKFGNKGIKKQQGSTIIKYDTLPLNGAAEYRFFEGSSQRNFPDSNTNADGNKLGVGSTMVVERAYLSVITKDAVTGAITKVDELDLTTGAYAPIVAGEFTLSIANTEIIKQVPVLSWLPEFNKNAENQLNSNFEFDTQAVIPPLLEYVAIIRTAGNVTAENQFLRLTLEGAGAIIAPRNTF